MPSGIIQQVQTSDADGTIAHVASPATMMRFDPQSNPAMARLIGTFSCVPTFAWLPWGPTFPWFNASDDTAVRAGTLTSLTMSADFAVDWDNYNAYGHNKDTSKFVYKAGGTGSGLNESAITWLPLFVKAGDEKEFALGGYGPVTPTSSIGGATRAVSELQWFSGLRVIPNAWCRFNTGSYLDGSSSALADSPLGYASVMQRQMNDSLSKVIELSSNGGASALGSDAEFMNFADYQTARTGGDTKCWTLLKVRPHFNWTVDADQTHFVAADNASTTFYGCLKSMIPWGVHKHGEHYFVSTAASFNITSGHVGSIDGDSPGQFDFSVVNTMGGDDNATCTYVTFHAPRRTVNGRYVTATGSGITSNNQPQTMHPHYTITKCMDKTSARISLSQSKDPAGTKNLNHFMVGDRTYLGLATTGSWASTSTLKAARINIQDTTLSRVKQFTSPLTNNLVWYDRAHADTDMSIGTSNALTYTTKIWSKSNSKSGATLVQTTGDVGIVMEIGFITANPTTKVGTPYINVTRGVYDGG